MALEIYIYIYIYTHTHTHNYRLHITLGGPIIIPVQCVRVMSSSFSSPQLIVPSPTPFCPCSNSSSRRKLRGTTVMEQSFYNIQTDTLSAIFIWQPTCQQGGAGGTIRSMCNTGKNNQLGSRVQSGFLGRELLCNQHCWYVKWNMWTYVALKHHCNQLVRIKFLTQNPASYVS
jgi:hypothetical protein